MPRMMLVVMAIGVGAVLTACSVEEPVPTGVPPLKSRQEAKAPDLRGLSPKADEEPYTYDTSNRRDPFRSLISTNIPSDPIVQDKVNCPPTQEFELASHQLVAIVWGNMGRKAVLRAANGGGYSVTEEMLIGRNCGRIRRIESNAVVIEETRRDTEGKILKEEVVLRLREREG